jgi:hypothetical protein
MLARGFTPAAPSPSAVQPARRCTQTSVLVWPSPAGATDSSGGDRAAALAHAALPLIFTIGHSTLQPDGFLALLRPDAVDIVWDIRSYPVSRWTRFRREQLEVWLPAAGVEYRWVPELGGRRGRPREVPSGEPAAEAPSGAERAGSWREEGFFNYQWYMTTPAFLTAADELIELGRRREVAIMCAEGLWWRCHRSMVSDYLVVAGANAVHLQPSRAVHDRVIGDRLERYDPSVLAAWRRHLGESRQGFHGAAAAGM